jgi:hypothetical protein
MFYLELFVKRIPHHATLKEFSSYFTLLNPFLFLFFKIPHLPHLKTYQNAKTKETLYFQSLFIYDE